MPSPTAVDWEAVLDGLDLHLPPPARAVSCGTHARTAIGTLAATRPHLNDSVAAFAGIPVLLDESLPPWVVEFLATDGTRTRITLL
jgi:hypothetical protein